MKEIFFSKKSPDIEISSSKRTILGFFNLHNVWWANKRDYFNIIKKNHFRIFCDGKTVSRLLRIPQQRGPAFTKRFLSSSAAKTKNHFFIGLEQKDLENFSKITGIKKENVEPYHSDITKNKYIISLPDEEVEKISSLINKNKSDYIWIGIGSPKQEFIADQLFNKIKAEHLICIGAGKDFLLGKKSEAPAIWQKIGLEWFYRLVTDFNHSKIKVWRSFTALMSILYRDIKLSKRNNPKTK